MCRGYDWNCSGRLRNNRKKLRKFIEKECALCYFRSGGAYLSFKTHYLYADEMPDELLVHLVIVSKKIVKALKEIYRPNGYSIMQNGGEFNDVGYYHMHIFPRYEEDGLMVAMKRL